MRTCITKSTNENANNTARGCIIYPKMFRVYTFLISINQFNFFAMKQTLLFSSLALVCASAFGQDCTKPFISEYVEGWSNNKAIEIYNPTDQELDMKDYYLQRYDNGSPNATPEGQPNATTIQLKGKLPAKSVIVYVIDLRDPNGSGQTAPVWDSLQLKADQFIGGVYDVNKTMFWNGDDAVVLGKGSATNPDDGELIDVIGKIGERPTDGWSTVSPYNNSSSDPNDKVVTKDHSLIRKETIKKGHTPVPPFGPWNPLAEWDSIPPIYYQKAEDGDTLRDNQGKPRTFGNWKTLGSHKCECGNAEEKEKTPPPPPGTDTTSAITNIDWNSVQLYPNPTHGIFFTVGASDIVNIQLYNALGQEVYAQANDSHAIVAVHLKETSGVYLVRLTHRNGTTATKRLVVK